MCDVKHKEPVAHQHGFEFVANTSDWTGRILSLSLYISTREALKCSQLVFTSTYRSGVASESEEKIDLIV